MAHEPPRGKSSWTSRLGPYALLTALGLLFFADQVVHPDQVLYSDYSDLWALHLPAKHFLVHSWRESNELPLWCPYRFAGTPFIHDIQVGAFYPPHVIFYLLPETAVGPALSWLIVLHVLVAGWGMFAYARSRGLNSTGALVAAVGFMFAGRWLLHLLLGGHYITAGVAWLPLILLLFETSLRRRSLRRAAAAGIVFAVMILGTQPQWTLYSGLFIVFWTLEIPLEQAGVCSGPTRRLPSALIAEIARWLGLGMFVVVTAAGLSAVQLLPTTEAAGLSTRAAGVASGGPTWEIGLLTLRSLFGPAVTIVKPFLQWEERGGLCLTWLAAAGMAPFLCARGSVRYQAAVCLLLLLFGLGGAALVQGLPGFRLFRQPSRMFIVTGFPVAYLAGVSVHALTDTTGKVTEALRSRCRWVLVSVTVSVGLIVGGFVLQLWREGVPLRPHAYWLSLLLTVPGVYGLIGKDWSAARPHWGPSVAFVALMTVDLWALVWPAVSVRSEASVLAPSAAVEYLVKQGRDADRVLDRDVPGETGTPLGAGAPLAMCYQLEALRGYTPLDVLRYKEYLQFIGDSDRPLRALDDPLAYPVIPDFALRNRSLLDLLGVKYLLEPTTAPVSPGWRECMVDADAQAYDFAAGGVRPLPAYSVYENAQVMPRAFVVAGAAHLPDRSGVLESLKHTDFRRQVLLEGWQGTGTRSADDTFRPARIRDDHPNGVTIEVPDGAAGFLVLTDVWFPGWQCRVDGEAAEVLRADYLFRAVPVSAGRHEVVFQFKPGSYFRGRAISAVTGILVIAMFIVPVLRRRNQREATAGASGS